jgi:hypothetical protein
MPALSELVADKAFLRSIAADNYRIPAEIDPFDFSLALLQNFATTDAQLRDELTYMILAHLIIDEESAHLLTAAQRETLLLTCVDADHLLYGIGEAGSDTVFMRSFSLLIVAALLYADARTLQLSEKVTVQARDAVLRYAREERDWRGYVQGKGWAHSVAHLSDALDEFAESRYASMEDRQAILDTLTYLATLPEPLCYEEDDRLAIVAYRLIARQLVDEEYLERWLETFFIARQEDVPGLTEQNVVTWVRASNAKNFLRSLFFRLLWHKKEMGLLEHISNVLRQLDPLPTE